MRYEIRFPCVNVQPRLHEDRQVLPGGGCVLATTYIYYSRNHTFFCKE